MLISYMSDLHLEFAPQPLPGGDVLILAGDIMELRTLSKSFHSTRSVPYNPNSTVFDFWYHECAKYNHVLYVLGNHEHYNSRFDETADKLRVMLPKNVVLLEDSSVELDGVIFWGGTLWTDCNHGDPITEYTLRNTMNDYKRIQNRQGDWYGKLQPQHTAAAHTQAVNKLKTTLELRRPTLVITHHAPSFQSVPERYHTEFHMNGAYASELSNLILDHTNISHWIHGHMHDSVDYRIGTTRILSNPRGYVGYEPTTFDVHESFTLL